MLLTALLVRLSSPGPIFFVQPRVGFNNELIRVLKFRTMYADRSDMRAEQTTTADDPRVTPIGRTLRKLSLDELPQLFNVIRGDMSLVGTTPARDAHEGRAIVITRMRSAATPVATA